MLDACARGPDLGRGIRGDPVQRAVLRKVNKLHRSGPAIVQFAPPQLEHSEEIEKMRRHRPPASLAVATILAVASAAAMADDAPAAAPAAPLSKWAQAMSDWG